MLDANAVLRFLLQDIDEQFQQVQMVIRTRKCYVTLEVMAEACYVLEGVYQVTRYDIARIFRKLNNDVTISNADVFLRALEIYENVPKLDFVDCLLCGYKTERGIEIVTFHQIRLLRRIMPKSIIQMRNMDGIVMIRDLRFQCTMMAEK